MLAELDRTGESQISLTDPDSRAMAAHTHVGVGYNEQQVTNQVLDLGLLTTQTAIAFIAQAGNACSLTRGRFSVG